jgi:3-deoxy-D-manno-octulosonic-acid transferase
VVNGRISDRSLPGYRRIRGWLKRVLAQVDCFLVQSESDKQRLIIIGACPDRVQVTGNLKFDVEPPRPPSIVSSLSAAFTDSAAHPILVCGSTVEGEEPLLLQAFQNVLASYPRAIMILAPRHPERFPEVAKLLEKFGIRVWQRSLWSGDPIFGGVLLLDTIGELAALYSLATVAFVGGSLVPRGGHSIIEPAQYGVPIIVGNHTENFRDVVALFQSRNAIRVVGPAELPLAFMELIGDEQARARLGSNATITLRSQQGATERTLVALSRFLAGPSGNTKSGNHACEPAQP